MGVEGAIVRVMPTTSFTPPPTGHILTHHILNRIARDQLINKCCRECHKNRLLSKFHTQRSIISHNPRIYHPIRAKSSVYFFQIRQIGNARYSCPSTIVSTVPAVISVSRLTNGSVCASAKSTSISTSAPNWVSRITPPKASISNFTRS